MKRDEQKALEKAIAEITEIAEGFGLDFMKCVMKFVQLILFTRLGHTVCRHVFPLELRKTIS